MKIDSKHKDSFNYFLDNYIIKQYSNYLKINFKDTTFKFENTSYNGIACTIHFNFIKDYLSFNSRFNRDIVLSIKHKFFDDFKIFEKFEINKSIKPYLEFKILNEYKAIMFILDESLLNEINNFLIKNKLETLIKNT